LFYDACLSHTVTVTQFLPPLHLRMRYVCNVPLAV
jgi:hypothetical protein